MPGRSAGSWMRPLLDEAEDALRSRVPDSVSAGVSSLKEGHEFESGVRLGFALGITAHEGHAWGSPWLRAAHTWLAGTGCGVAVHDERAIEGLLEHAKTIRAKGSHS